MCVSMHYVCITSVVEPHHTMALAILFHGFRGGLDATVDDTGPFFCVCVILVVDAFD